MAPANLHVIGIDPGGTTGWCRITIPRKCLFGTERAEILDWKYSQITGPEEDQVAEICRRVKIVQGMDYQVGPAIVCEGFDIGDTYQHTTNQQVLSPVRIAAMLVYARKRGDLCDAKIVIQSRAMAKSTMTDERLERAGYWIVGQEHARDATKHAITALRRARQSNEFRDEMWNARACTL